MESYIVNSIFHDNLILSLDAKFMTDFWQVQRFLSSSQLKQDIWVGIYLLNHYVHEITIVASYVVTLECLQLKLNWMSLSGADYFYIIKSTKL